MDVAEPHTLSSCGGWPFALSSPLVRRSRQFSDARARRYILPS